MSFGFSVGDFIAALELVATVAKALGNSSNSSAEYQGLLTQLLVLDGGDYPEIGMLHQAVEECHKTIEKFWRKARKYHPSLREGGSGNSIKDGWRKIQWTICMPEDVTKFRDDLRAQTQNIEIFLMAVQFAATTVGSKKNEQHQLSLMERVQDTYSKCVRNLTILIDCSAMTIQQGNILLDHAIRILHIVVDIQSFLTSLPLQVMRQQPVYFIDALGRETPFYLEFIKCPESLLAVLLNNFKDIGPGADKVRNGHFAIQDVKTKMDIDLSAPWETCFFPGQKVVMSMLFTLESDTDHNCLKCGLDGVRARQRDHGSASCSRCHTSYQSAELTPTHSLPGDVSLAEVVRLRDTPAPDFRARQVEPPADTIGLRKYDNKEHIRLFRNLRLKLSILQFEIPDYEPHYPRVFKRRRGIGYTDDSENGCIMNYLEWGS